MLFGLCEELNIEAEGLQKKEVEDYSDVAADYSMSIDDLGLQSRSYNALNREGIRSVGELVARSEADLLDIRNFGAKSIEEIKHKLAEMGMTLKDTPMPALGSYEEGGEAAGSISFSDE